ncbi:MAG TPA: histidine kinase [Bacteroidia bacterium]|nr:histidine kinase [Bacteroidia bacterium]
MKNSATRILVEVIAWCALFIFPVTLFPGFWPKFINGSFNPLFLGLALTNTMLISFYYLNYHILIPKFYFTKKYFVYIFCLFIYLFLIILVLLSRKEFNPLPSPPFRYSAAAFAGTIFMRFIMIFLCSLGISTYDRLKHAEREKMKAELSYLKAQINPHFLFNTLNSIYALTVKKSDVAPESVTKLSGIMRYVITDAAQEFVALDKEIDHTSNYIALEELRVTSKVNLQYKATGEFTGKKIAPLIFIPFIENAFKHGVSTKENSSIQITIFVEGKSFNLLVKNTKVNAHTVSTGIGIDNAKMRLKLLYPGKYSLDITDGETEYSVSLKIDLND